MEQKKCKGNKKCTSGTEIVHIRFLTNMNFKKMLSFVAHYVIELLCGAFLRCMALCGVVWRFVALYGLLSFCDRV